jgi:ankyrin repeat protein
MATNAALYEALSARDVILATGLVPDAAAACNAVGTRDRILLRMVIGAGAVLNEPDGWGYTPMTLAINFDDLGAMKDLLVAGVSPNAETSFGPPLIFAILRSSAEAVKLLIDSGADLQQRNESGATPLIAAARTGDSRMVQLLLDAGADASSVDRLDHTAYDWAVEDRHKRVAAILQKATPRRIVYETELDRLLEAIRTKHTRKTSDQISRGVQLNERNELGWSPLETAIDSGNLPIVKMLLRHGARVDMSDVEGVDPLESVVRKWKPAIILALLKTGAHPRTDTFSDPVITAAAIGSLSITRALLKAGSNPNSATASGETSLMSAANAGALGAARLLLSVGAEVNAANNDGWTALFYAVQKGGRRKPRYAHLGKATIPPERRLREMDRKAIRMVRLLLDIGASVNLRDKRGKTPLAYANSTAIVRILLDGGASLKIRDKKGHSISYWLEKSGVTID